MNGTIRALAMIGGNGARSFNQRGRASENDVRHDAPAKDVAEQASDKKSGNGRRSEYRQNGEGFGQANLHLPITERREHERQHHVDGCNHRGLRDKLHGECVVFFHFFVLL